MHAFPTCRAQRQKCCISKGELFYPTFKSFTSAPLLLSQLALIRGAVGGVLPCIVLPIFNQPDKMIDGTTWALRRAWPRSTMVLWQVKDAV